MPLIDSTHTPSPQVDDADPGPLANMSRQRAAMPAVLTDGLCWSYRELARLARERAGRLRDQGLREGQLVACPVGLTDRGAAELILMQHALAIARSALLPLAPDMAADARDALLADTGCEWQWRPGETGVDGTLIANPKHPPAVAWVQDRLALVLQTSGSSGRPKAVMLGTRALLASCVRVNARLQLGAGDRWLAVLPRQHIGGLAIGWRCALAEATLQLQGRFDAQRLAQDLQRHPITHLSLVPAMLARLLDRLPAPPPALRAVLLGGQAPDRVLTRQAITAGWPLYQSYGMTETASGVAIAGPLTQLPDDGLAARPLPSVEIECPRCPEPPGPIRLRGPMLMAGYARPGRAAGDGLDDGWLTTADLGCLDAAGRLRVTGRADAMVVIGGVNVHPGQVEARCRAAPGVDDCAVTAVVEPGWGHRLILIYQGPAAADALERWCRAELPSTRRPRGFVAVDAIPRLASGKPDRQRLDAIVQAYLVNTGSRWMHGA